MEQKIINCTVSEEYIIGAGECIGRAGSHDETALVLEFRDIWCGLSKTLFWTNADGTNGTMQILTPDMLQGGAETYRVPVPYGAKTRAGWAKLTIRGVMVEGETETVCAVGEGEFEVMEAEMPEDYREQLDIDATAAEQIMAGIENIKGDILTAVDSAKEAADAAERAETAQSDAKKAAEDATDAAQNAESYTINPPRPVDGVWEVWDGKKYIRTNEPSRGEDGADGAGGANINNIELVPDGEINNGGQPEKGEKGDKGDPGDTPYIQNGYWYISGTNTGVKAQGVDGKDGKDGKDGAQGIQGIQGIPGVKGDTGATGAKGDKGDTGATGATGAAGKDGVSVVGATLTLVSGDDSNTSGGPSN